MVDKECDTDVSFIKDSTSVNVDCCNHHSSSAETRSASTSIYSSCQIPVYLQVNISCKKVLLEVNKSILKEIKHLKKLFCH